MLEICINVYTFKSKNTLNLDIYTKIMKRPSYVQHKTMKKNVNRTICTYITYYTNLQIF